MTRSPIQMIKSLWALPSANVLAAKEYDDAQRQLLMAQREHAYTGKLVEFYEMRLKALAPVIKASAALTPPTTQYVER